MNRTKWVNRSVMFFVFGFYCTSAISQPNGLNLSEVQQDALQQAQRLLEDVAKNPDVMWIEVSCFPFGISTRPLRPEDLDEGKVFNIQKIRTDLKSLFHAIRRTRLKEQIDKASVKLAITLYNAEKMRLVSIYMSPYGDHGYIDSTSVVFEETPGDAYDWLYENFASCFRGTSINYYKERQKRIMQKQTPKSPVS